VARSRRRWGRKEGAGSAPRSVPVVGMRREDSRGRNVRVLLPNPSRRRVRLLASQRRCQRTAVAKPILSLQCRRYARVNAPQKVPSPCASAENQRFERSRERARCMPAAVFFARPACPPRAGNGFSEGKSLQCSPPPAWRSRPPPPSHARSSSPPELPEGSRQCRGIAAWCSDRQKRCL